MNRILVCALTAVGLCAQTKPLRVALPGKAWALEMDAPGFVVSSNGPEGARVRLLASNERTGVALSMMLEQIPAAASAMGCQQSLAQRNAANEKLNPVGVKISSLGAMSMLEFVFAEVGGVKVQQKNLFACLAKEDVYADIHISKAAYTSADNALFTALLQTVRFTGPSAPPAMLARQDSVALFAEGSRYYLNKDFKGAIGPYRKSLEQEKTDHKLAVPIWRALIDNLGMSYGITGDLKAAEEVFRYGLSRDPEYPMFHYNLACTAAERNDMEGAMKYLTTAFQFRKNANPGEPMPDPHKDDSFQRFMKNETFLKLIDSF